ncbi:MAG: plasmid pRiA4b ORF-3 family protein, partial [Leptolyngbya sp. RL_3_1]|nr:plasmid pRiA4b ORF-3 family protein [Leptolyngbya sp. RL_3_1]
PEWQQNLLVPHQPFRAERHIFKVSLGKVWRRIAITGEATLANLSELILDSVDFDHDHLDQFTYKTFNGRTVEVCHPDVMRGSLTTEDVQIGRLPLAPGSTLEYLFDFGDCWRFQVQLETVEAPAPEPPPKGFGKMKGKMKGKKKQPRSRQPLGEVIEVHGAAPDQYPDYDDDW